MRNLTGSTLLLGCGADTVDSRTLIYTDCCGVEGYSTATVALGFQIPCFGITQKEMPLAFKAQLV